MAWRRSWDKWVFLAPAAYGGYITLMWTKPWIESSGWVETVSASVLEFLMGGILVAAGVFVVLGIVTGLVGALGDHMDAKPPRGTGHS